MELGPYTRAINCQVARQLLSGSHAPAPIAKNTRLRQKDGIALFTSFLNEAGMDTGDLMMDWRLLSEIYSLEALLAIEREFLVGAARVYPGWP
jgi:hypothetical protein